MYTYIPCSTSRVLGTIEACFNTIADGIVDYRSARNVGRSAVFDPGVFVDFIRSPHCASFAVTPRAPRSRPMEFIAVNAHLLYGTSRAERKREFDALLEWLVARSRKADRLYAANYVLLGDLNLDFDESDVMRTEIDVRIKALNATRLSSLADATCNFPLLTPHPKYGQLRTNARRGQTYDHIGFFSVGDDLPSPADSRAAGTGGISGYDYGVFSFTDLFAVALYGVRYDELSGAQEDEIIGACEHDVSDHLPVWARIPRV